MTTWKVIEAPVGAKAADCFERVSQAQAKSLRADGFEAVGRYCQNVTQAEIEGLTAEGLGVFFILEGLALQTRPTSSLGESIANAGIARLRSFGVPSGASIAGDLEGEGRLSADWIDFGNGEARAIKAARHIPVGYFGEGLGLSSIEIYRMAWERYWQSGSRVVDRFGNVAEPACGWCALQGRPLDIERPDGLTIDVDVLWEDFKGRRISLLVAA